MGLHWPPAVMEFKTNLIGDFGSRFGLRLIVWWIDSYLCVCVCDWIRWLWLLIGRYGRVSDTLEPAGTLRPMRRCLASIPASIPASFWSHVGRSSFPPFLIFLSIDEGRPRCYSIDCRLTGRLTSDRLVSNCSVAVVDVDVDCCLNRIGLIWIGAASSLGPIASAWWGSNVNRSLVECFVDRMMALFIYLFIWFDLFVYLFIYFLMGLERERSYFSVPFWFCFNSIFDSISVIFWLQFWSHFWFDFHLILT